MQQPATPENEDERIQTLHSLNILDTASEERFNRLTRLAKQLFQVPIAVVSLVDTNRQWFKSCLGLDATETSRDVSFCGHTILGSDIFLISDTLKDKRFADNPLVTGPPHIRFYAGAPLSALDGNKLGTLCIIDDKPRSFNINELAALKDLAMMAEQEIIAVQLATLDDLTKISNRLGFITLAEKSLNMCQRQNLSASLIFFDLNDFKHINDKFGHAEGDRALISFAEAMVKTFRDSDIFARLGGDEFVVLLTDAKTDYSEEILSRFKKEIEHINQANDRGYNIEYSSGIVTANTENLSIDALLKQADALMYKDKMA
jgi:diguanylate cyclase (GGDEF)-like protein